MSSSKSSQFVEVQLEIGHRGTLRAKPNPQGHTHDWVVFVRGPEGSNIEHFVEKVVFHLHESFPKPKRVFKEPPYEVSESGYAGFEMPIEVYFKNKDDPKKISFEYDLFLRTDGAVSNLRREKLTFKNPSAEFKKKLLKAGGVTNESNTNVKSEDKLPASAPASAPTSAPTSASTSASSSIKPPKNNPSISNEPKKSKSSSGLIPTKDKSLVSTSSRSSSSSSSSTSSIANSSAPTTVSTSAPVNLLVNEKQKIPVTQSQFTDLFGPPIQARTSDLKIKESSKSQKYSNSSLKTSAQDLIGKHINKTSSSEKSKSSSKISEKIEKEFKSDKESSKSKQDKSNKSKKSKAQTSPSSSVESLFGKKSYKNKRRHSTSSACSSINSNSYESKDSPKTSSKEHNSKKESKKQKVSSKDIVNSGSGVKKQSSTSTKISFSDNNSSTTIEIKSVKKEKTWDNELKKSRNKEFKANEVKSKESGNHNYAFSDRNKSKDDFDMQKSPKLSANKHLKVPNDNKYSDSQREQSISPSPSFTGSITPGRIMNSSVHAPIAAMIAEMQEQEHSLSPLSSNPASPLHFESQNNKKETNFSDDSMDFFNSKVTPSKEKLYSSHNSPNKSAQNNKRKREPLTKSGEKEPINEISWKMLHDNNNLKDLAELQRKINDVADCNILQKIVDIIEESGTFHLTTTTFDFDLMKLDQITIRKLKNCLA